MYGVVLMMALNQSVELPDRGGKGCCGGCMGCYGGGRGCHGGCWGGCYGGCWGGGCYGGGCYGGGWGGCYGGGGFGGCYGGGMGGCYGGMGGGCYGGISMGGCYGGIGMGGCYGGMMPAIQGGTIQGGAIQGGENLQKMPRQGTGGTSSLGSATIVVTLPEDATLTIDDNPTTSTSGSRTFVSPPLDPGKDYHYDLKATVNRDGKSVVLEKRVVVHSGETTPVTLSLPESGAAQR